MVAPITLDMQSQTQRTHASETIHAYCLNHALHLVALIVLPQTSPAHPSPASRRQPAKPSSVESRAFTMWDNELHGSPIEPVAIVSEYFDLLIKSYGRVILMATCLRKGISPRSSC